METNPPLKKLKKKKGKKEKRKNTKSSPTVDNNQAEELLRHENVAFKYFSVEFYTFIEHKGIR